MTQTTKSLKILKLNVYLGVYVKKRRAYLLYSQIKLFYRRVVAAEQ